ncbi:choice-of-anchor Q domain-containing protein [Chiayiivirga flava]|uniref:Right handed beta helix domain-containing protein n=1 Tax=Chiayiivirga flava TaxID=659595 RepID=A0A7W8G314_9GAMM|nr:choice-of-anchor Q domain-containing protein [Chiayiivirga flava]MBB5209255.1 hypothetical protein [Chiayiivirga flava]
MTTPRRVFPLAFRSLAAAALVGIVPAHAGTPVVRVDASASGANDGTSWSDAYTRLDVALAAAPGAEIWVARGVYVPPPNSPGDVRNTAFMIRPGTRIYGGFAGNELVREARDPGVNRTVLSGDLDGNDGVDADGIVQHADDIVGDNAFHVVLFDTTADDVPFGPDTRLDGVVVTAGKADGVGLPQTWGGGGRCVASAIAACSPTLANVEFRGNYASERAGGFAIHGGEAPSDMRFENVLFRNNLSDGEGGALHVDGLQGPRTVHLEDVRFDGNAGGTGGALYVRSDADVVVDRGQFVGNRAEATDPFFADGGAIRQYGDFSGSSVVRVYNSTFSGNVANGEGGVAYNGSDGGDAVIEFINVTASGNRARLGGVLFSTGDTPVIARIRNSLFWGNTATEEDFPGGNTIYGDYYGYQVPTGHRVEIADSLLEGGLAQPGVVYDEGNPFPAGFLVDGGGNLSANPRFASGGALRVRDGSPAIDAGDNAWNATEFDVAGLVRRFDGDGNGSVRIDIGAHEFGADGLFADGFED